MTGSGVGSGSNDQCGSVNMCREAEKEHGESVQIKATPTGLTHCWLVSEMAISCSQAWGCSLPSRAEPLGQHHHF